MEDGRLLVAKAKIHRYFQADDKSSYGHRDLVALLEAHRTEWGLANVSTERVLNFLLEKTKLKKYVLPLPVRAQTIYLWRNAPLLEQLGTVRPTAYFSHHTALYLQGLATSKPATIYLNNEQAPRTQRGRLKQAAIDRAFRANPRATRAATLIEGQRVCFLNGMHTGNLGVTTQAHAEDGITVSVRVTGLERTLIDSIVRPAYSGGIAEVLHAYSFAKDRISIPAMSALLDKLNYVYPYHQAIGYALQKAGHRAAELKPFYDRPRKFDFYLVNNKGPFAYVKEWRLYIPQSMTT